MPKTSQAYKDFFEKFIEELELTVGTEGVNILVDGDKVLIMLGPFDREAVGVEEAQP